MKGYIVVEDYRGRHFITVDSAYRQLEEAVERQAKWQAIQQICTAAGLDTSYPDSELASANSDIEDAVDSLKQIAAGK